MELDRQVRDRRPGALGNLHVLSDELLCAILDFLHARDLSLLACVSSVMYILCNEEPLWLSLCIRDGGPIQYKGSWKKTLLQRQNICSDATGYPAKRLHFDGFSSLFLYRRWYRCFTTLNAFSFNSDGLQRNKTLPLQEFRSEFDGKKPVLLTELVNAWPAKRTWTIEQLLEKYGDTAFRISQRSSKKITMKFSDYVSYMEVQHDEDPLYIFDDEFGEAAPALLKDYSVPHLFQEDFSDVLDCDQRPPFRWLIIGPERSGASWHVDPGLTSAWNTLLVGKKRWALYPPGRVPVGVTVHVNEEDGDVDIDTSSSLQWWLDVYPLLAEEDKPLECTQLPGETIYVPSGWWHCVLNLETTVAVTQNFVNASNFEFVCLDMSPGHIHKGVSRAGLLAIEDAKRHPYKRAQDYNSHKNPQTKRLKTKSESEQFKLSTPASISTDVGVNFNEETFSYDSNYLSKFLDPERDHYTSPWSFSNYIGQREMRSWLHKLWIMKPDIRPLLWKGASFALSVERWSSCLSKICSSHSLPLPSENERFPVGTGSNPVYITSDYVIKIYAEGGFELSLHSLGTELQFYEVLRETESPLQNRIPQILASGILVSLGNNSYETRPWDEKGSVNIPNFNASFKNDRSSISFTVWSKQQLASRKTNATTSIKAWAYLITKRCQGDIFANIRDSISKDDALELASFIGCQLKELHLLPVPTLCNAKYLAIDNSLDVESKSQTFLCNSEATVPFHIPAEYEIIVAAFNKRREDLTSRLQSWGSPTPVHLIERVHEYIPDDVSWILNVFKDPDGLYRVSGLLSWLHMDIMDDNLIMRQHSVANSSGETSVEYSNNHRVNDSISGWRKKWSASHILDFSNLSIGDPMQDLIPIYLDIFRGDSSLLDKLLASYGLPLNPHSKEMESHLPKYHRLSYRAMCYCLLHEENVVGAIFSLWKDLRSAKSWEEVEEAVWGSLNSYSITE